MNWVLFSGALNGLCAVSFGAFGAHALKNKLSEYQLSIFQTGNHYHFIHLLVLVLIGFYISKKPSSNTLIYSAIALNIGIILFSGSLYIIAVTGIKIFGAITPIGGVSFLVGWFFVLKFSI